MVNTRATALLCLPLVLGACVDGSIKDGFTTISAPPTVIIQEPSEGSSFRTNEPILFRALAQSTIYTPDELLHTWTTGAQTICETQSVGVDGYATCAWTFDKFGEQTIEVNIVDPNSDFGSDTVTINVVENFPPTITVNQPEADAVYPTSSSVPVELMVDDAEDSSDALVITASSSLDGDLSVPGDVPSDGLYTTALTLSPGEHLLNFTVTDSLGAYASASFFIVVTQKSKRPCRLD